MKKRNRKHLIVSPQTWAKYRQLSKQLERERGVRVTLGQLAAELVVFYGRVAANEPSKIHELGLLAQVPNPTKNVDLKPLKTSEGAITS